MVCQSDGDGNVIVGETWCESGASLSESESDDGDGELGPLLVRKRCSTQSELSATCFAISN